MATSRRNFIQQLTMASAAGPLIGFSKKNPIKEIEKSALQLKGDNPADDAQDEDFWYTVQQSYRLSPDFINLDHGFYSPTPHVVTQALFEKMQEVNSLTSFYMRKKDEEAQYEIRSKMADFTKVPVEELLIMRSTTEALETVILGLDIKTDEEILLATTEYPNFTAAWDMKAKRFGVNQKKFVLPLLQGNDAIIEAYKKNIGPKTKYILISHCINMNGQILPVKQVTELAHQHGIEVICDASHSFIQIDYKISDLDAEYFGTSLHKWLSAPVGTGMLQIKKDKIKKIWPLFGDYKHPDDNIRKFERIGTYPAAIYLSIASALQFHNAIGTKRKEARLRYLKNYWVNKIIDIPSIKFLTPLNAEQSCAITTFYVQGKDPQHTADYLFEKYKIFTVAYDRAGIKGVRVTPNVSNTLGDLDKLVEALRMYCKT